MWVCDATRGSLLFGRGVVERMGVHIFDTKRIINIVNNIVVWDGKECSQLVYPRTHSRTIDPRKIKT